MTWNGTTVTPHSPKEITVSYEDGNWSFDGSGFSQPDVISVEYGDYTPGHATQHIYLNRQPGADWEFDSIRMMRMGEDDWQTADRSVDDVVFYDNSQYFVRVHTVGVDRIEINNGNNTDDDVVFAFRVRVTLSNGEMTDWSHYPQIRDEKDD